MATGCLSRARASRRRYGAISRTRLSKAKRRSRTRPTHSIRARSGANISATSFRGSIHDEPSVICSGSGRSLLGYPRRGQFLVTPSRPCPSVRELGCWRADHNGVPRHSQLGCKTPSSFAIVLRRDLALRHAEGSGPAPAATPPNPAKQPLERSRDWIKLGHGHGGPNPD